MFNVSHARSLMFALGVTLLAAAGLQGAQPLGFWRVETAPDGFCSAVSPAGERQFMRGVDHVSLYGSVGKKRGRRFHDMYIGKYGNRENWAAAQVARVREAGFNLISIGSPRHLGMPHAILLQMTEYMARSGRKDLYLSEFRGGPGQAFPNVFSPEFEGWCDRAAARSCAPHREDRDLFGYFIDNELAWKCLGTNDMAYVRKVAERYFSVTTAAIRRHDPNHLILGCRFAGVTGAPDVVWEVCGKYCDVVSFNCYPKVNLDCACVTVGRLPAQEAFADRYRLCGKPMMVTEWSFPSFDTGLPCLHGAGQRYFCQSARVAASEIYATAMMRMPFLVGYSYFKWIDDPAEGYGPDFKEDCNYGLFNINDEPYQGLISMFARIHGNVDKIRRSPATPSGDISLRFAYCAEKFMAALERLPASGGFDLSEYADFMPTAEFFKNGRRIWVRDGKGFRLEFKFSLVKDRPAILVEFVRIVNTGGSTLDFRAVVFNLSPLFKTDKRAKRYPHTAYTPMAEAYFETGGSRYVGLVSRAPNLTEYAMSRMKEPVLLSPGESYEPALPVYYAIVAGKDGRIGFERIAKELLK